MTGVIKWKFLHYLSKIDQLPFRVHNGAVTPHVGGIICHRSTTEESTLLWSQAYGWSSWELCCIITHMRGLRRTTKSLYIFQFCVLCKRDLIEETAICGQSSTLQQPTSRDIVREVVINEEMPVVKGLENAWNYIEEFSGEQILLSDITNLPLPSLSVLQISLLLLHGLHCPSLVSFLEGLNHRSLACTMITYSEMCKTRKVH